MAHQDRRKPCHRCEREVAHTLDDRPYTHRCVLPDNPNGFNDPYPAPAKFPALVSVPAPTVGAMDDTTKGPWFGAMHNGRCSECEDAIHEGDRIRVDSITGRYECEDCGEAPDRLVAVTAKPSFNRGLDRPVSDYVEQYSSRPTVRAVAENIADLEPLPAGDEFEDPTEPAEPQPILGVSGQPKHVLRDHLGRYAVVLPGETELEVYKSSGNPVGRTRATTFNKSATDKKNINDWGKRNVLIGASRRRDLVLQASGLTHENDRDRLNALVLQLEETAGSKVGSDLGTYLHEFTEYMDAGLKTWREAPEEFQRSLRAYEQALRDAGLEPIRSLIERTTIIREYGWVCGTFDRIFFHRPSGQYVIGDLKTGKTMDYGKNEIETQLWTYGHGANQNGIYDWNTRTWGPIWEGEGVPNTLPPLTQVSETVGVVIHMPVQGPKEGTVTLLWADLASGAAHAQVCADVRARPGGKMRVWGDGPAPLAPVVERTWEERFSEVTSGPGATALWREARAAGIAGVRLNELISIAREALRQGLTQ